MLKDFKQMQIDYTDKNYKEHRGVLIKKYRSLFGKFVLVIEENNTRARVCVGKCIFDDTKLGSKLTIGEINHKLINIRPGICKNNDE